jgi:hypothetical protein
MSAADYAYEGVQKVSYIGVNYLSNKKLFLRSVKHKRGTHF